MVATVQRYFLIPSTWTPWTTR